jgi:DNA-binding winged helix-turn-helix (wHTH) protein
MYYAFGDYTLDATRYELRRAGVLVSLAPRAFDLLTYLVQHAGQTVSKEELFAQLWAEQVVTDAALTYCVTEVRKALGDSGRGQRYIRIVHGRGYRFIMPMTVQQETAALAPRLEALRPPPPAEAPRLDLVDTVVSPSIVLPAPPAALSSAPEPASPPAAGAPAVPRRRVAPADGAGVSDRVRCRARGSPGRRSAAGGAAGLSPTLHRRGAPVWRGAAAVSRAAPGRVFWLSPGAGRCGPACGVRRPGPRRGGGHAFSAGAARLVP